MPTCAAWQATHAPAAPAPLPALLLALLLVLLLQPLLALLLGPPLVLLQVLVLVRALLLGPTRLLQTCSSQAAPLLALHLLLRHLCRPLPP